MINIEEKKNYKATIRKKKNIKNNKNNRAIKSTLCL